jgi:hypothetical protein
MTPNAFQPSKSGSKGAFVAKIGSYVISGRVVDSGGAGIPGVNITLSGSNSAATTTGASGFAFWVNNVESCGADAGCREAKRVDTSAAFFLSIEFQETGFLAHRFYRAAFNRLPRYREFVRDTQELGRNVVVG